MEISYLGKNNFKLKTKSGSALLEPTQLTMVHKSGGEDFVINEPGEYEIEGISVFGYQTEGSTAYVFQAEDMRVLYLGELSQSLSEKNLAELENIDVVIAPPTASGKELVELVTKIEPYYILPYGENVAKFVASYDHGSRSVKSLSLSKLTLPEDLTEVIVFE